MQSGPRVSVEEVAQEDIVSDSRQFSVRDLVNGYKREVLAGDLTPYRASEIERALTALLGNLMDEQRIADSLYAEVLAAAMKVEQKANRAKVIAETSQEFLRKREVSDTFKHATQLIISLRGMIRMATEEMRLQR